MTSMKKPVARTLVALALTAACSLPVGAQTTSGTGGTGATAPMTTTTTERRDDHGNWGWLGLLGLAGLLGLRRKAGDRDYPSNRTTATR
jgi:MYXO-CTERM domain-containing protein